MQQPVLEHFVHTVACQSWCVQHGGCCYSSPVCDEQQYSIELLFVGSSSGGSSQVVALSADNLNVTVPGSDDRPLIQRKKDSCVSRA